ncbi:hypothetical protein G9A89_016474 [Geosiphon pyriformis]|nr:hypothetical protein G9A89_016474 [Geosiphon pyriformis]
MLGRHNLKSKVKSSFSLAQKSLEDGFPYAPGCQPRRRGEPVIQESEADFCQRRLPFLKKLHLKHISNLVKRQAAEVEDFHKKFWLEFNNGLNVKSKENLLENLILHENVVKILTKEMETVGNSGVGNISAVKDVVKEYSNRGNKSQKMVNEYLQFQFRQQLDNLKRKTRPEYPALREIQIRELSALRRKLSLGPASTSARLQASSNIVKCREGKPSGSIVSLNDQGKKTMGEISQWPEIASNSGSLHFRQLLYQFESLLNTEQKQLLAQLIYLCTEENRMKELNRRNVAAGRDPRLKAKGFKGQISNNWSTKEDISGYNSDQKK